MAERLEARPDSRVEVFSVRHPGEPLGTIAIPTRDHMNAATVMSLLASDMSWMKDHTVSRHILQGSVLTTQRNEAVRRLEGEWLLFIDDDMTWEPDAIGRIVAEREKYDLDILGGLCFRRGDPYQPTLYMREQPTEGLYNVLETWDEDAIVEVDATGMAFCLIHRRVFEMIADSPLPPLEWRRSMPPPNFFTWRDTLGEDLRFCQDAKAAGARIFVHTGIPIGHVAEVRITRQDWLRSLALRDQGSYEARKVLNDGMGLPTVTSEEAWQQLGWTTPTPTSARATTSSSTRTPTSSCSRSQRRKESKSSRRSTSVRKAG